ncbi:MAG: hypothetical protein NWE89_15830 [Candidatus Bathyarchaeota archaeon]|nr:hypothetical protein [Candidatus Bathyarchaeota archaeon]
MAIQVGAKMLRVDDLGAVDPGHLVDITVVQVAGNHFLTPMYDPLETLVYVGSGGRDVRLTIVDG